MTICAAGHDSVASDFCDIGRPTVLTIPALPDGTG